MSWWARSGRPTRWPADCHFPPPDLSKALHLPRWLDAILSHDRVAFPLHAVAGAACNAVGGPTTWAVAEWLKAAAHARSVAQRATAARGLAAALERTEHATTVDRLLAATVSSGTTGPKDVIYRRRQLSALAQARRAVETRPGQ